MEVLWKSQWHDPNILSGVRLSEITIRYAISDYKMKEVPLDEFIIGLMTRIKNLEEKVEKK
jgi:hypothetical protein